MAELPAEFRHEPDVALAGGIDGLDLVRKLLSQARATSPPADCWWSRSAQPGRARTGVPDAPFTWLETHAGTSSYSSCATTNCPPEATAPHHHGSGGRGANSFNAIFVEVFRK